MNIPYQRKYDKEGNLTNPIKTAYVNEFPNRQSRRKSVRRERFHNNRKTFPLVVTPSSKYLKQIQVIGNKRIEHYVDRHKTTK